MGYHKVPDLPWDPSGDHPCSGDDRKVFGEGLFVFLSLPTFLLVVLYWTDRPLIIIPIGILPLLSKKYSTLVFFSCNWKERSRHESSLKWNLPLYMVVWYLHLFCLLLDFLLLRLRDFYIRCKFDLHTTYSCSDHEVKVSF